MNKEQILVAFGTSDAGALGNTWRITAQSTDFYVKALRIHKIFHLSVHGPNNRHPDGHRFHVKVDSDAANKLKARGDFLIHTIPEGGVLFDGRPVGSDAYHVARIRWHEELQRPEFRQAATYGSLPDISNIVQQRELFPRCKLARPLTSICSSPTAILTGPMPRSPCRTTRAFSRRCATTPAYG